VTKPPAAAVRDRWGRAAVEG